MRAMFEPLQVGEVVLPNRIMQTAHSKGYADNGVESPRDLAYYLERAQGGVGLIIAGGRGIDPSTLAPAAFASGYVDGITEADRRITEAVHRFDTKIFAQTNHFGVNSPTDGIDELHELISASDVPGADARQGPAPHGGGRHGRPGGALGARGRAHPRGRLRRRRDPHGARLPPAPVLLAALQPPHRRVRRRQQRGPGAARRPRAAGGARACRRGLHRRRAPEPGRLLPRRHGARRRDRHRPRAGGDRPGGLLQPERSGLPRVLAQHPAGGRSARRLARRVQRAVPRRRRRHPRVPRRRDSASGAGRLDPRRRPGGRRRPDTRAARRAGVGREGALRSRGGDHALHPREPGLLHEPHARLADPLHRQPRRGPRVGLPPLPRPARERRSWLVVGGGPPA